MDKILTFIKKYTSLLIPAGIALCALLLLIPTLLIGGSLKEKIIKSERQGNSVSRSVNTAHSKKDVVNLKYYQDKLQEDSKRVVDLAKQTTQRELISPAIFPEPDDSSVQIYTDFGTDYRVAIEELLKRANARSAPTTSEIKQQLANRGNVRNPYGGGAGNYRPKRKGRGSDRGGFRLCRRNGRGRASTWQGVRRIVVLPGSGRRGVRRRWILRRHETWQSRRGSAAGR